MYWTTFNILSMQRLLIRELLAINIPGLSTKTLDLAWVMIPNIIMLCYLRHLDMER